jgi:serine/threonine protein phosphatase PrpC/tRNA A-37 threonylcarbamoyl transferase component Bud32
MQDRLAVSIGQCSATGRKELNQDFHGAVVPEGSELGLKGVALAIADGISTSPVAHVASETAVKTFLSDYYCTSDAWSARTAAVSVITAANAWLHSETRLSHAAYDLNRGYVCTFSALVLKGRFAHLFHVGDSRIYRLAGESLEQLTTDHRVVMSATESYLARALGMAESVDIECAQHPLVVGEIFVLCTDGVFAHLAPRELAGAIRASPDDLDAAAKRIVEQALAQGGDDNLTIQIVRVEALPDGDALDYAGQTEALAPPPIPAAPGELDGYILLRLLHANERSHIFLATDGEDGPQVALKIPAQSLRQEPALLRQFMMEEWIARRVTSPHVLRAHVSERARNYLYVVNEFVEGQSLRQWMHDNPAPDLVTVRNIIEQIVRGLRALHRKEMIHCDLRPENVLIDRNGTVKIIDFGSVRVTGLVEAASADANPVLGTVQYTAPEWLAGEAPTWRADLFSVAVIAYEMLTGELPYGAEAARVRSAAQQRALRYATAHTARGRVPAWVDGALRKALQPDPARRHDAMSEFVQDLLVPNPQWQVSRSAPLLERNPVAFWRGLALLLMAAQVVTLILLLRRG